MHKYLEKKNEVNFDKIFNQMLGEYLRQCGIMTKHQHGHRRFRAPFCNLVDA